MLGVGVGFDTKGAGKITIQQPKEGYFEFQLPDSREGGVEALKLSLEPYFLGKQIPKYDFSLILPAGVPIRGFGGIASGPGPLKQMLEDVQGILNSRIGQKITSLDIVDIMNLIGKCVVAGNVRRSAEIKNPRRNIPKALFYTVVIVAIIYLLIVSAIVYSVNIEDLTGSEIVEFSPPMTVVIIICAAIAVMSSLNVALMAASRNVYALSRDKFLSASLSRINSKFETPQKAIIITFIISLFLVLSNQVEFVASITNLSYMIIVSSVGLAVLKLRKFEDKISFKLPFHPIGPILCIILPLILIPFLEFNSIIICAVWTIIGVIIYRITKYGRRSREKIIL
ncbi:MAG: amino acid permease [Promethearchaeota archaeon]